jgi:catalase
MRRFTTANLLVRLASIAGILLAVAAALAVAGGWLSPRRLGPGDIVDSLQIHDGLHPGFRRAHAKGICIEGVFQGNGDGKALSKAQAFEAGDVPAIGRFSTGGGQPYAPDGRLIFRSLAVSLTQPNGEQWRLAMDDVPIFLVATPQAFRDFQLAAAPDPSTGKPDPAGTADFLAHHPETQAFMQWLREAPLSSSFANSTYYSINAFRFTNAADETRHVRWSLVPEAPFAELDKETLGARPADFLFEDVVTRLQQGPLRWHMIVSVAAPNDPVDDATRAWPGDRPQVDVGTLIVQRATTEETGACRNITFDPLILPQGIAPSDDPLLPARSAAYFTSLRRRDGEPAAPSAAARDAAISKAVR